MKLLYNSKLADQLLSANAASQPLFLIIQLLMPTTGIMSVAAASSWRVYMTLAFAAIVAPIIYARQPRQLFLWCGGYAFLLLFYLAFFPATEMFILHDGIRIPWAVIFTILSVVSITDISELEHFLLVFCRITAIVGILFGLLFLRQFTFFDKDYFMSYSYALLFPILYLFTSNWKDVILSILCYIFIIMIGSRGGVIIASAFFFLYLFISAQERTWSSLFLGTLCTFILILFVFPEILNFSGSRTLNMLFEGDITDDSGRKAIWDFIITKIMERPFFGWGIGADRQLLFEVRGVGSYSHNIVLELCVSYGLIIGLGICLFLAIKSVITYKQLFFRSNKVLFTTSLFAGIFPLMLSSSYLLKTDFGLFIGILILFSRHDILEIQNQEQNL